MPSASILAHEPAPARSGPRGRDRPAGRDRVAVQRVARPAGAAVETDPGADALEAFPQILPAGHGRLLVLAGEPFAGLPPHTGVARLVQVKVAVES